MARAPRRSGRSFDALSKRNGALAVRAHQLPACGCLSTQGRALPGIGSRRSRASPCRRGRDTRGGADHSYGGETRGVPRAADRAAARRRGITARGATSHGAGARAAASRPRLRAFPGSGNSPRIRRSSPPNRSPAHLSADAKDHQELDAVDGGAAGSRLTAPRRRRKSRRSAGRPEARNRPPSSVRSRTR